MAGFLDNIGEFFTGSKQKAAEEEQARQQAQAQAEKAKANAIGGQYIQGAAQSMGTNAADYMAKANAAATGQAQNEALTASRMATRNALGAARTAGVNRGQAAMLGAQQAGNQYTNALQSGLQAGRNQYQNAANQFATIGQNQQAMGQGYTGQLMSAGTNQYNQAQGQGAAGGSAIAAAGQAAMQAAEKGMQAYAMSDKNLKTGIKTSSDDLEELLAKVRPVDFKYNGEAGQDPNKARKGVLAQDLEKTSMADNVVDTPQGKAVDIPQQTLSNTNLIVQLAQELYDLKAQMKAGKNV